MEKKKTPRTRPLFVEEIGQEARDLLGKGYCCVHGQFDVKVSTFTTSGTNIKSALFVDEDLSTSVVMATYNFKGASFAPKFYSNTLTDLPSVNFGQIVVQLPVTRESPPPSAMAEIAVDYQHNRLADISPAGINANLKIWCLPHRNVAVTLLCNQNRRRQVPSLPHLNILREIGLSASFGTPSIAFGIEGMLGIYPSGCFTVWDAGIQVSKPAFDASVALRLSCTKESLSSYNKGDWVEASYVHYMDEAKKISGGVEMTLDLRTGLVRSTIGGSWAVDDQTVVKARFDNSRKLKALMRHNIYNKARLSISGEYDVAKNSGPSFGLALVLKPNN